MNISPESYNFGIPLHFPQFYFSPLDLSVLFNGRDYCAYKTKEDADHMKNIESEVHSQFKVDQKDYISQVLT